MCVMMKNRMYTRIKILKIACKKIRSYEKKSYVDTEKIMCKHDFFYALNTSFFKSCQ